MSTLPKGPWRVVTDTGVKRFDERTGEPLPPMNYYWVKNPDDQHVAVFCGMLYSEQEAEKARLLAAAPEMVDALKLALRLCPDELAGSTIENVLAKVSRVGGGEL